MSKLNGKWINYDTNNLTHTGDNLAAKFRDGEAANANYIWSAEKINTISGVLSAEIDSDISTHAASDDHDGRYYTETEINTWRNSTTQTEMGYVNGVTSDIQTQLDDMISSSEMTTISGDLQTNIDAKDNYTSWSFAVDGVTKDAIISADILNFVGGDNITITRSADDEITISGAGDGVTDHGDLTGLDDDDHTQYHNDTRGDARYYTQTLLDGGQLDNRYYTETEVDTISGALQTNIDAIDIQPSEAEYFTLTSGNISDKYVTLAYTPYSVNDVVLDIVSGCPQSYGTDYTVSGTQLGWSGLGLDGVLEIADELRAVYTH